ncbi:MAG: PIN domain-containing protein [Methanobacteriota archaeon]
MKKIAIDTNILVFANIIEYPEYRLASKKMLDYINNGVIFSLNSIVISEVYHILSRILNIQEAYSRTKAILDSPSIFFEPINQETVFQAIGMSSTKMIRINDAIIASQAIGLGCAGIFTDNVKDFKKCDNITVFPLRSD